MATTKEEALKKIHEATLITGEQQQELDKIAASATTPLKPDTSEDMIYIWRDPKQELPAKDQEVILLLVVKDSYQLVIGQWVAHLELWQTDLGPFPLQSVTSWCNLPKVPKGI